MNTKRLSRSYRVSARQRGLTLIELLVGLVIALFLLAGVVVVLQSVRQFFGSQAQMAQLQDNERLAMNLLTGVIQTAGYFPDPTANTPASSFPVAAPFAQVGQAVFGTANAAAPGDSITVRYLTASNDGVINCIGGTNTSGATQLYVNAFSIDNQGRLACVFNGGAAVPLVQGLQNLQVFYGVKTDFSVDNRSVDSYLRANEMTATNWSNVISVRITLNFTNPLAGQPGQPATIPFTRVIDLMGQTGVKT